MSQENFKKRLAIGVWILTLSLGCLYLAPGVIARLKIENLKQDAREDRRDPILLDNLLNKPAEHELRVALEKLATNSLYSWVLKIPDTLQEFFLAFTLGALGAMIAALKEFLQSREAKGLYWYVFRPIYGFTMALAVTVVTYAIPFILVGGAAALKINAYVLAFLCLTAGLFSDSTHEFMQDLAKRFMGRVIQDGKS